MEKNTVFRNKFRIKFCIEAENGIATKFYLKNVLTRKERNANVTLCYITIFHAA